MDLKQRFERSELVFPDYNEPSLIDLIRLLYSYCGNTYKLTKHSTKLQKYVKNKKHILLILCDGMGSKQLELLPIYSTLRKNKIMEIQSVNPTSTGAVLTSLMTAKYPATHGMIGWYNFYREKNISYCTLTFKERIENKNLKELNIRKEEIYKYPSILDKLKRNTYAFYPEKLVNTEFSKYSLSENRIGYKNIEEIFKKYETLIQTNKDKETFTYIYLPEIDELSHYQGIQHKKVLEKMQEIEKNITELKSKEIENLEIIIISDHGQIDIKDDGDITLNMNKYKKYFYALPTIDFGTTSYYIKKDQEKQFEEEFHRDFKNNMYLFKTEEYMKYKIFGNEEVSENFKNNIGEYISFTDKNYYFINSDNTKKYLGKVKGSHSGFSKDEFFVPLIVI